MKCKKINQARIDAVVKAFLKANKGRPIPTPFKVGERVEILRQDIFERPKNKRWYGRIVSINGGYHYVRPMRCKWETELYDVEIAHA